jgi:hypothetical protein
VLVAACISKRRRAAKPHGRAVVCNSFLGNEVEFARLARAVRDSEREAKARESRIGDGFIAVAARNAQDREGWHRKV